MGAVYTRKIALHERLEEAFRGSRHHAFLESLKGVTEEQAQWTPPGYVGFPHMTGSILNLAFHAGGDKHVLLSTAFGDGSVTWDRVTERFQELGHALDAARILAEEGHAEALRLLDELPEERLDEVRPYYGRHTLLGREVYSLIAEHDLYHTGQIQMVRCLLAGRERLRNDIDSMT